MDIFDDLSALKLRATEQLPLLNSKRKRETALLLPFFAALGYNPFDVREVEPGYAIESDAGGAKTVDTKTVDYALKKDRSPAILVHLENMETNFDAYDPSPLLGPLTRAEAPVGALTDGIEYRFYADLDPFYAVLKGETTAEEEPFLTFNLLDYSEGEVEKLRRLTKPEFRAGEILSFAHHLKYTRLFRKYLQHQRENPGEAFVRFMMEQVHGGKPPKGDAGMYASAVKDALRQLMRDSGEAQVPVREETNEEKTEGGAGQSEEARDEEDAGAGSNGEPSIDLSFRECFQERLER